MRAIDMHTHLPGRAFGTGRIPTADFLAMLDAAGIDQAVVMTVDGLFYDYVEANNRLAEQADEAPDRLIPFCTVDPYSERARAEIYRCVEKLGFRGVKLHPPLQGFSPLDPCMRPVAAAASELQVPILFHDGTPPYSTPLQVAYLCESFPDLKVILGHGGRMDLWMEAVAAVKRYPTCFVCLCGVEPPAIFARMIRDLEAERVTIGTDAGWTHDPYLAEFRMAQFRALAETLTAEEANKIFWENAAALLGLA